MSPGRTTLAVLTSLDVCPEDHVPVVRKEGPGRPPRYCSRRCQQAAAGRAWAAKHRVPTPPTEPTVLRRTPSPDAALALTLAVYGQAVKDGDRAWLGDPEAQGHWRPILAALWAATVTGCE